MPAPDYRATIPVRFRDLDPMGHVNNAVYATYLEQTRAMFYRDVIGEPLHDVDTVLVHLEVDFKRPILLDDSVTVEMDIDSIGTSSFTMSYTVLVDDAEVAATGETVQVVIDEDGRSAPIPEEWIDRIERFREQDVGVDRSRRDA